MKKIIFAIFLCSTLLLASSKDNTIEQKIDSLLTLMTLDEKIGQLTQYSGNYETGPSAGTVKNEFQKLVKEGKVGSFLNVHGATNTHEMQKIAVEQSRLKIPLLFGYDVIHGYRTTFPIPLAEASSWDPQAVEKSARISAIEAAAAGVHWTFAPMVDIARDPRWGRIAEGSGEDPYLGSAMAAARVKGFQGNSYGEKGTILSCAKHFAAYGGAEGGRDYNTVDMSERTLREIYLLPYKAAVDAGAATIMSSFNEIAGVPSTGSKFLLTDVLRKEWHFDGFVVSDWTSIPEMHTHGVAANDAESAMLALNAGTDMDMEGGVYRKHLPQLLKEGKVSEQTLNEAVRRILRVKLRLGLFADPYRNASPEAEKKDIYNAAHIAATRDVARKSIVLLKNEKDILPLKKEIKTLAVVGPLANNTEEPLGPWHQQGRPSDVVTVLDGITKTVSSDTKILFAKGCDIVGNDTKGFDEAVSIAKKSDVVIVVVGEAAEMSGEAASRSSLTLPGKQEKFVEAIQATGTPVVVVLMNGRPLAVTWIAEHVSAIVEAWFLGVQSGNAIADVLFGEYTPSGKLPVTFPRTVGQVPYYYNYKNTGRPMDEKQKYNSKYIDISNTPLFPFGYGLSYTTFEYSSPRLSASKITKKESLKVVVDVKNIGRRAGEEVVQLYIRDEYGSVTRPVKELKGFQKIALVPGEKKSVEFTLTPELLSMYDINMKWGVEAGTFKVYVGTNSVDVQEASFEVSEL